MKNTRYFKFCTLLVFLVFTAKIFPESLSSGTKPEKEIKKATIAFNLKLKNFFPEGIAYDPINQCFYMGSLVKNRIVKILFDGTVTDFISSTNQDNFRYIGLRVDSAYKLLWACAEIKEKKQVGITKFDLGTGKLIKKYMVSKKEDMHLFNDAAITKDGTVYITSFAGGTVYKIDKTTDQLSVYLELGEKKYTNGIDVSPDERFLFMAVNADILRIGIKNKEIKSIQPPENESLGFADGLYYYKGGLVAVQTRRVNQKRSVRVARSILDKDYLKALKILTLVEDHPYFEIPTTGAIVNDEFYFIATSYIDKLEKKLPPKEQPDKVIIMNVKLN